MTEKEHGESKSTMKDRVNISPKIGGREWEIRVYPVHLPDGKEYQIKVRLADEEVLDGDSEKIWHLSAVKNRRLLRENEYHTPDGILREHIDEIREYCVEYFDKAVEHQTVERRLEEEFEDEQ